MKFLKPILLGLIAFYAQNLSAQTPISADKVCEIDELYGFLKPDVKSNLRNEKADLASHFRSVFVKRYFYNWQKNPERLDLYKELYDNYSRHEDRGFDHLNKYPANTKWLLPFNYKNGQEVNAYALRHLARQHKMIDIAMLQKFSGESKQFLKYFTVQMNSLNEALSANEYETIPNGNGVYEAFRSGYRVLNWLKIHSLFLDEKEYTDEEQLTTIATLLQHGQHLFEHNQKFKSGNHQTRGMSALAMLAIVFQDFEGTAAWYDLSMQRLEEHLDREINDDGFQFERSVHYHMSDINNYYYVYQLAKINEMPISDNWEEKLKSLFTTLVKIAYPDKSAPVLQDDTDNPWAEKNDISVALTLGYLLFEDPQFGYFAKKKVSSKMYWFLSQEQLNLLGNINAQKPKYGSLFFPDTKYYFMREGYNRNDKVMVVSAGLDSDKPDHQHGDMLGIQATANGKIILPNYQVRYSLPDYEFFKNSMVKNVALVDDELQGKQYRGNRGGSGFGKFKELPNPSTINWQTTENHDLYVGSHDGFDNVDVSYTRQVLSIENKFWIVKDNFKSNSIHDFKQIWQGHYNAEGTPDLLRASWDDATGCDIYQLHKTDTSYYNGTHGKQWNVVSKEDSVFSFVTLILPYKGYNKGINLTSSDQTIAGWDLNKTEIILTGKNSISLTNDSKSYVFGVSSFILDGVLWSSSIEADLFIEKTPNTIIISSLDDEEKKFTIKGGDSAILDGKSITSGGILLPTSQLIISI